MRRTLRLLIAAATGTASIALAGAPDDFQRVVDALAAGSAHPEARAPSARVLAALGATPADGAPDLARAWAPPRALPPPAYRDRVLGAAYQRLALAPHGRARFEQTFFAGQSAHVAVVPLDRAPFAIRITDEDGRSRCPAPHAVRCDWVPAWTARFRIELENAGAKPGRYYVVMQ